MSESPDGARRRAVASLFAVALACRVLADVVELVDGTSRAYANRGAAIVAALVAVIGVGMLPWARAAERRYA